MGPKKGKDADSPNAWRTIIEDASLDEENWKVKVVIIEEAGSEQDRIYLNKFEVFAAEEKRFVIKNICKSETIFMINQLGGDKKVKDESLRVFEEGQSYLKDKKDIPSDILALIIKHLILKMKEEYLFIKRQRLEVKEGMRRESNTMIDKSEVRGTVNIKSSETVDPIPPKAKGKKDDQDFGIPELEEGKKYNTMLRVRGEEWRDKVYVDDYPTDGPNLYVAVTGFMEPNLACELIKIGIPLRAVVQVRIDSTTTKVPSSLSRATKRGQSQTELLAEKSYKFWEDLQSLRINKEGSDYFKQTAFIVFSPPYWDSETLSGKPDKIYDELSFLMYDIQDLTRQHLHYLENMDVINIPKDVNNEKYENYYHEQIDDISFECVTLYSIIDGIMQTVCNTELLEEKYSKYSFSTPTAPIPSLRKSEADEVKKQKAETFIRDVFNTLCMSEADKKAYRLTYGPEYEEHKNPIIINYGDFAKYSTFHLDNINLDNLVWSSLFGMPLHKLWANQKRNEGELEAKINFHINVLLSCFQREDVEISELNRLLHILSCRKLFNNRSSLKKKHLPSKTISDFKKIFLKRSVLAEPLCRITSVGQSLTSTVPSFPSMARSDVTSNASHGDGDPENSRIKFLFDCPDISELVSAAEISNECAVDHLIDDFEYFEDFSGVSAFQVLFDTFNKFNCIDYKYCEVTDCFVLIFFNSHDQYGISRDEWRCHLATPLCLQDFFDFVLEQHYDWVQNEEKIYDETMKLKSQSECKVLIDSNAQKSCIGDMEIDMDLLIEGSLKFQEIAEQIETDVTREESKTEGLPSKKTTLSITSTDMDSKSSRKQKSPASTTPKSHKQSFMASTASDSTIEISPKPFFGYNLGDRRVEVFGKDAAFFSRDGTRVNSMYTLIIPMNIEYVILNVIPGNSFNEFWIHKALGDTVKPEIVDTCESFRISSKDQVMINIKKNAYEVPLSVGGISTTETNVSFETRKFHSLYVTWPNGLITESIHENKSPAISHIKQYHISPIPNLNEYKRCISLNGEVLVFKTSGEIEVLRPDGSYIIINKHERRQVIPDVPDEISIVSSDKSKKSKGKDKGKEKTSRILSKSKFLQTDEVKTEQKPSEYELVIQDFEYIETSGIKQKWINNIPYFTEHLLTKTATDFCIGEIFSKRMDGTRILLNKNGHVVTFPNNTRIITKYIIEDEEIYPEWTDEELEYFDLLDYNTVETGTIKSNKSRESASQSYLISQESTASSFTKKVEIKELKDQSECTKKRIKMDGYVSIQLIYVIEHNNFTTVTINKSNGDITVESPNNTSVVINTDNNYNISLDAVTTAVFDGENLHIKYEACPECRAFTKCDIKMKREELNSVTKIEQSWLQMKDSFCKKITVDQEGNISILNHLWSEDSIIPPEESVVKLPINILDKRPDSKGEPGPGREFVRSARTYSGNESMDIIDERQPERKSESSVISHGKCREKYLAKMIRFFVMQRDLTCSELVHRSLIETYKRECRWQPWCSVNQYDTFGDQRSLLSLLTPVHQTETEKWLMESKLADKPKYLTYKDLKPDSGKGFYHWMRPYERFQPSPIKQENVLPPRYPRAFILRTLEQQWKEAERDKYKGAKELINAILQYRHVMESDSETLLHVPIIDPRSEDERKVDDVIQALAHRIYEDLRFRLSEDVTSRAKPNITTKPIPQPEEISVEGETEEDFTDDLKTAEEERLNVLKQVEEAEPMSPNLKKYWRRRAEEYKEEQYYKSLLREGNVPPYFRDVLGGAVWWDLNNIAGDAVSNAERERKKCVCTDRNKIEKPLMNCICTLKDSFNDNNST